VASVIFRLRVAQLYMIWMSRLFYMTMESA